eukprot:g6853.t1
MIFSVRGSILATCPRLRVETASTQTGPFKVFRRANTLSLAGNAGSTKDFKDIHQSTISYIARQRLRRAVSFTVQTNVVENCKDTDEKSVLVDFSKHYKNASEAAQEYKNLLAVSDKLSAKKQAMLDQVKAPSSDVIKQNTKKFADILRLDSDPTKWKEV